MDVSQDIWSCKMRYLSVCLYWICLLKSIKDNGNKQIRNWKHYARPNI
jgi:hypothetical protein